MSAIAGVVEEHCHRIEAGPARAVCGVVTSEYADMSNDKAGEIPARRKPEVSWATFFVPGLVGT